MNYLGHLFFSKEDSDLMVANLFGDFVKGKDYSHLPKVLQEGVFLHRQIDDFIDTHKDVKNLRLNLYSELPKIAGIAIDLYFDHLLAKNWSKYHPKMFRQFVNEFTDFISLEKNLKFTHQTFEYPLSFRQLLNAIVQHDLLMKYINIDGLSMAAKGLSKRISFPNNLNTAAEVFIKHEKLITSTFHLYMTDAIERFDVEIHR